MTDERLSSADLFHLCWRWAAQVVRDMLADMEGIAMMADPRLPKWEAWRVRTCLGFLEPIVRRLLVMLASGIVSVEPGPDVPDGRLLFTPEDPATRRGRTFSESPELHPPPNPAASAGLVDPADPHESVRAALFGPPEPPLTPAGADATVPAGPLLKRLRALQQVFDHPGAYAAAVRQRLAARKPVVAVRVANPFGKVKSPPRVLDWFQQLQETALFLQADTS
ncbi:MAG TPA: hypothetical protein PLR76_02460 [Hyphomonas sp.]|nr:hypothetical protein [Hyphomonas sp.]